jgi:hypothetical protein
MKQLKLKIWVKDLLWGSIFGIMMYLILIIGLAL